MPYLYLTKKKNHSIYTNKLYNMNKSALKVAGRSLFLNMDRATLDPPPLFLVFMLS